MGKRLIITTVAAAAIAAVACRPSAPAASEGEQREAERICERFGGVAEVHPCDPPVACLCQDRAYQQYRGVSCSTICADRGGVNELATRMNSAFRWTGGEVHCADTSVYPLSLHGCAAYISEPSVAPEARVQPDAELEPHEPRLPPPRFYELPPPPAAVAPPTPPWQAPMWRQIALEMPTG